MCLSTIYIEDGNQRKEVCNNIMSIKVENEKVICTNLLGITKEIIGTIQDINLMDNYVVIQTK